MPKAGAFDKAKKKGTGGFGASKSGRFDAPKESNMDAPSATAYSVDQGLGARARKSASKLGSSPAFGSRSVARPKALYGQDTLGPGAYVGNDSSFSAEKVKGPARTWGSTPQHQPAAFMSVDTPSAGTYDAHASNTVANLKPWAPRNRGFGHGSRFEKPQDVVQVDYDVDNAHRFFSSKSASQAKGAGFGGFMKRGQAVSGVKKAEGPGPGAYKLPGALKSPKVPSAAFGSRSVQHSTTPGDDVVDTRDYDVTGAQDPYAKKSFSALAFGVRGGGGFGSSAPARPPENSKDNPGPGEYNAAPAFYDRAGNQSASFASASQQRGATMLPSHADGWSYNPAGIGSVDLNRGSQVNKGFGGADRGLLEKKSDKAEVAELRALFA